MYATAKKKVYLLLHPEISNSGWDRAFNAFIILLILLNVTAVMLETVPSIHQPNQNLFTFFDDLSVAIFTIEYILRVWSANYDPKYRHSIYGRLRYMVSAGALIDLLAILPWYLQFFVIIRFDLRVLRILRLLRFIRLFRLTAYTKSTRLLINVFKSTRNELQLSLVLALFLIVISSCLVYFAEHAAQPHIFTSIPNTIWWSVTSLTTVGYGDMIPVTTLGKLLTSLILLAGVAIFALPAGIITAGFLDEIRKLRHTKESRHCPRCGMPLEEADHSRY